MEMRNRVDIRENTLILATLASLFIFHSCFGKDRPFLHIRNYILSNLCYHSFRQFYLYRSFVKPYYSNDPYVSWVDLKDKTPSKFGVFVTAVATCTHILEIERFESCWCYCCSCCYRYCCCCCCCCCCCHCCRVAFLRCLLIQYWLNANYSIFVYLQRWKGWKRWSEKTLVAENRADCV